ncbi:MAG: hypothetical protein ACLUGF_02960 [Clostridium sp.]
MVTVKVKPEFSRKQQALVPMLWADKVEKPLPHKRKLYTLVSYKPRTKEMRHGMQARLQMPWRISWYEATASMSGAGGGANSVGYSVERIARGFCGANSVGIRRLQTTFFIIFTISVALFGCFTILLSFFVTNYTQLATFLSGF